jgi:hypothetical protein
LSSKLDSEPAATRGETLDPGLRRDDVQRAVVLKIVIPAQAGIQWRPLYSRWLYQLKMPHHLSGKTYMAFTCGKEFSSRGAKTLPDDT